MSRFGVARLASKAFIAAFLSLWVTGLALFLTVTNAHNSGTTAATPQHTVAFTQHNYTKYITPAQQRRIELLLSVLIIGGGIETCFGLVYLLVFRSSPLGNPSRKPSSATGRAGAA